MTRTARPPDIILTVRLRDPREQLYALACGAMFVFGLVLSLPGTVLGLLIGSFTSGPLVDALGQRTSLLVYSALVGVCLPLFGASTSMAGAVVSLAAIGLVSAGVNTAANALASDTFPHERGRRMNGIAVMVGLGGLAMPLATAATAGTLSWRAVVNMAGLLAIAIAAAGMLAPTAARPQGGGAPLRAMRGFLTQRRFGAFCLLLLLAGANEASVAGWTSTYLGTEGFTASHATLALASHWLGLVCGRLAFSRRVDRNKRVAVIRGALGVVLGIIVLATTRESLVLGIMPFVIGLALSIVMPTLLAMAGERFTGNAGTLFGLLLTLAQVGGIVVPALVGSVADRLGVRVGLLVIAASALVVAVVARTAGAPSPSATRT